MATYAVSDVHGCYDELMELVKLIGFSDEDTLSVTAEPVTHQQDQDSAHFPVHQEISEHDLSAVHGEAVLKS